MLDRNDYDLFIVSFPRARVCVARRRRVARAAAGRRLFSIFLQSEAEWNASRAGCERGVMITKTPPARPAVCQHYNQVLAIVNRM